MEPGTLTHVDPLVPRGPIYRVWAWLVGTRPMGWLSRTLAWKIDPFLMRLSRGRIGVGLLLPTALLETRGARSGKIRRNGVIYFHDGDAAVIIASKLGDPEHPSWYFNARANPDVRLGGHPFRAEIVGEESERRRLWDLAYRVFPAYAAYQRRAARANRTIPILRLSPPPENDE